VKYTTINKKASYRKRSRVRQCQCSRFGGKLKNLMSIFILCIDSLLDKQFVRVLETRDYQCRLSTQAWSDCC